MTWQSNIVICAILILSKINICGQNKLDSVYLEFEKQIFESKNDSLQQYLLLKKINTIIYNEDYQKLNNEFKRIDVQFVNNNQLTQQYYYNYAVLSLISKDFLNAYYYFKNFQKYDVSHSINTKLLELLCCYHIDKNCFENTLEYLIKQDSLIFYPVFVSYQKLKNDQPYNSSKYILASALIPGIGNILLKQYKKGLISLALFSLSALGEYWFIYNHLYLNAVFYGSIYIFKFYIGNIKLTKKSHENHIRIEYEKNYFNFVSTINYALSKYPIKLQTFKILE